MSHRAVREFLKAKAEAVSDAVKFGYGRSSDFNKIKNKKYPYIWLDPLNSTLLINEEGMINAETYSVNIVIYKLDNPDSTEDEYKLILDDTDKILNDFIRKVNEDLEENYQTPVRLQGYNTQLSGISKQPFIKTTADVLTGWILSFELTVPDTFDYCE